MDIAGWLPLSPVCASCVIGGNDNPCYVSRKSWELIVLVFGYRLERGHTDSDGNFHRGEVLRDPDGVEPVLFDHMRDKWIEDSAILERLRLRPLFEKLRPDLG